MDLFESQEKITERKFTYGKEHVIDGVTITECKPTGNCLAHDNNLIHYISDYGISFSRNNGTRRLYIRHNATWLVVHKFESWRPIDDDMLTAFAKLAKSCKWKRTPEEINSFKKTDFDREYGNALGSFREEVSGLDML